MRAGTLDEAAVVWLRRVSLGSWCILNWVHATLLAGWLKFGPVISAVELRGVFAMVVLGGALGVVGFWRFGSGAAGASQGLTRARAWPSWCMAAAVVFWGLESVARCVDPALSEVLGVFFFVAILFGLSRFVGLARDVADRLPSAGLTRGLRLLVWEGVLVSSVAALARVLGLFPGVRNDPLVDVLVALARELEPLLGLVVAVQAHGVVRRFRSETKSQLKRLKAGTAATR